MPQQCPLFQKFLLDLCTFQGTVLPLAKRIKRKTLKTKLWKAALSKCESYFLFSLSRLNWRVLVPEVSFLDFSGTFSIGVRGFLKILCLLLSLTGADWFRSFRSWHCKLDLNEGLNWIFSFQADKHNPNSTNLFGKVTQLNKWKLLYLNDVFKSLKYSRGTILRSEMKDTDKRLL